MLEIVCGVGFIVVVIFGIVEKLREDGPTMRKLEQSWGELAERFGFELTVPQGIRGLLFKRPVMQGTYRGRKVRFSTVSVRTGPRSTTRYTALQIPLARPVRNFRWYSAYPQHNSLPLDPTLIERMRADFELVWVQGRTLYGGVKGVRINSSTLWRWLDVLCDAAEGLEKR